MTEILNIRLAKLEDASVIAKVHVNSWQKIYKGFIPDKILDELSIHDRTIQWEALIKQGLEVMVIEKNSIIVGFASICPVRDSDLDPCQCGEISAFYLHPDVWREGLGQKLCDEVLSTLATKYKEVILWVLEGNIQARKFYEAMGFSNTFTLKVDEYEPGVFLRELRYRKKLCHDFLYEPLKEKHLNLLCNWLKQSHVKEWWDNPLTDEEIKNKYRMRIGNNIVYPYIVYSAGHPIGFIQFYYADKVGGGWWPDEIEGTVGIDQFIGEVDYLNKGVGTKIITYFIQKLFNEFNIQKIIVDVDPKNQRAIRCYEKAGFDKVGTFITPDGLAIKMELLKERKESGFLLSK